MSKIGKKPIDLKEGVSVSEDKGEMKIQGPRGSFSYKVPKSLEVKLVDGKLAVSPRKNEVSKAQYGLIRAILANMVRGVTEGFEKKLELSGVGYRAQVSGNTLTLSVGFSHPVKIDAPEGITFKILENIITVSGIDRTLVGDVAAKIRSIRPPEPYKGKGIRYEGERIRRKAGKAAKTVGIK